MKYHYIPNIIGGIVTAQLFAHCLMKHDYFGIVLSIMWLLSFLSYIILKGLDI